MHLSQKVAEGRVDGTGGRMGGLILYKYILFVCFCMYLRACERAFVRACVRACACVYVCACVQTSVHVASVDPGSIPGGSVPFRKVFHIWSNPQYWLSPRNVYQCYTR